jgi:hypothetical protein
MLAESDIRNIRLIIAAYNEGRAAIYHNIQTQREVALLAAPTIVLLVIAGFAIYFGMVSLSAIFLLSIVVAIGWAIHSNFLKMKGETAVQAVFGRLSPSMFSFVERLEPLETPSSRVFDRLPREFVGHFNKSDVTKLLFRFQRWVKVRHRPWLLQAGAGRRPHQDHFRRCGHGLYAG